MRSEVQPYQWGISIQIKTLSGHKQQEAKQDPSTAEKEDGRGEKRERARERVRTCCNYGKGGAKTQFGAA